MTGKRHTRRLIAMGAFSLIADAVRPDPLGDPICGPADNPCNLNQVKPDLSEATWFGVSWSNRAVPIGSGQIHFLDIQFKIH